MTPPPPCVCSHSESEHFRDTGPCMKSTPEEVWACACAEYEADRVFVVHTGAKEASR